jgi:hypothetical protein
MQEAAAPITKSISLVNISDGDRKRFWNFVNKNGPVIRRGLGRCWIWKGVKIKQGYGRITLRIGKRLAHRVSFALENGGIESSLDCCHKCDNPECVRPSHLFLGTTFDNYRDSEFKGRRNRPCGERVNTATINSESVLMIRELWETVRPETWQLVVAFGVSYATIYDIITNRTWKHLL